MPCMCGDVCCPSCGPAQGNWKCPICRVWASEGCEHFDESGELLPQFRKQVDQIYEAERLADDQFVQQVLQDEMEFHLNCTCPTGFYNDSCPVHRHEAELARLAEDLRRVPVRNRQLLIDDENKPKRERP